VPPLAGAQVITSYDLTFARASGYGGWTNTYNGTISPASVAGFYSYTGGSGTLNDGIVSTSASNNQLFTLTNGSGGPVVSPTITLHLDASYFITGIEVFGGGPGSPPGNYYFGNLAGATFNFGQGSSLALGSTDFGPANLIGGHSIDDLFSFANTSFASIATNTITLGNFQLDTQVAAFGVTEIKVFGLATPEPHTVALLAAGLLAVGWIARQRRPGRDRLA